MIIPTGGPDKAFGVHINKIYKTNATTAVDKVSGRDMAMISKFSTLVEHGRACAMALPDVRSDLVAQAKQAIQSGTLPLAGDIAFSMINNAVEGQV